MKLTSDDLGPNYQFGYGVSACDGTIVIGARGDDVHGPGSGSAYVFGRAGAIWVFEDKLVPSDGGSPDLFGESVAIHGDVAVVGAFYDDDLGTRSGSAYVFERGPNNSCSQVAKLLADDGAAYDLFGSAVGVSCDSAVIGAPEDDDNGASSGSAYVFRRDPNSAWTQEAKLIAQDGDGGDVFGDAVAICDDVITIGAQDDEALGNWSGSAYVFERDPNGVWSQAAKLLPYDGSAFWNFGTSVAASGATVVVGADGAHGAQPYTGAAYVFERDRKGLWQETAKLVAADGANSDRFGAAVGVSADLVVVGAWGDDDHGAHTGAAYVFVRQGDGSWAEVAKLVPDDGATDDRFGSAAAVSGNTAVVGAYLDDDQGEDSGSAYVFAVGPDEDGDGVMDVCLCPGDLDHDLDVDLADLARLLSNYGTTGGAMYEDGDLDHDGDVDLSDLAALLAEYGTICP